jgi:tRNA threonylcarbamoyladenosine biosynthesis protein TsaE
MIIADEGEMLAFGSSLAARLIPGDSIAIDGPLGAGKTVLCKGILRGLGFIGEVASPSYALVHHYDPPDVAIAVTHADLYRLNSHEEMEELGLMEASNDCITLIEWAKNGGEKIGKPTYKICITPMENGNRQLSMTTTNG